MDQGSWKTLEEENHMIKIFKQPARLKKIQGQSLSLKNLINGKPYMQAQKSILLTVKAIAMHRGC